MVTTDALGVAALVGLAAVPVTSFLKGAHWPNPLKFALALIVTLIGATVQVVVNGHVHGFAQFVALWATTLAAAQTFYHTYFGGTTFETTLNRLGPIARTVVNVVDQAAPTVINVTSNKQAKSIAADVKQAVDEVGGSVK